MILSVKSVFFFNALILTAFFARADNEQDIQGNPSSCKNAVRGYSQFD